MAEESRSRRILGFATDEAVQKKAPELPTPGGRKGDEDGQEGHEDNGMARPQCESRTQDVVASIMVNPEAHEGGVLAGVVVCLRHGTGSRIWEHVEEAGERKTDS